MSSSGPTKCSHATKRGKKNAQMHRVDVQRSQGQGVINVFSKMRNICTSQSTKILHYGGVPSEVKMSGSAQL